MVSYKNETSADMQQILLREIYIEKIDDVLAEYARLFSEHPELRKNSELSGYYKSLSRLIRTIRFGTARVTTGYVDDYLKKARAAETTTEVFYV